MAKRVGVLAYGVVPKHMHVLTWHESLTDGDVRGLECAYTWEALASPRSEKTLAKFKCPFYRDTDEVLEVLRNTYQQNPANFNVED